MSGMKNLLGDTPWKPKAPPPPDTHRENLDRVFTKIAPLIMDFSRTICAKPFTMTQLTTFVLRHAPEVAPDSPGRILRDMRQRKMLDYELISRRHSRYRFIIR
jgi:hypothetical protein